MTGIKTSLETIGGDGPVWAKTRKSRLRNMLWTKTHDHLQKRNVAQVIEW